jgi:ferrous iron transport protein B
MTATASARAESALPALGTAANPFVVAVIGNPNTGKTTLFNRLTGLTQRTGNYAGVTVESSIGSFTEDEDHFLLVDLPGSYSLSPRAPDEVVAVRALIGRGNTARPHVVLCIVDATNLDRNLYLLSQILDSGLPVVACLTMVDVAKSEGIRIDYRALEQRLGVPIVPVHASKRQGITQLKAAIRESARTGDRATPRVSFPEPFEREVAAIVPLLASNGSRSAFIAQRLLLDREGFLERELGDEISTAAHAYADGARRRLRDAGHAVPGVEIAQRYDWIRGAVADCVDAGDGSRFVWTRRLDAVLTHRVWGGLLFLCGMALVFQAIFSWATPFMDAIDAAFAAVGNLASAWLPAGALRSLVVDGVIGGAGAVVIFVPQIAILFALITVMEDSGYMARAAFLMDRVMASFGLSGRSFIPLLSSFACAVPGIMAARSVENRRDRLTTIMIAPLMSCSARLPVYVLFIAAFIPPVTVAGFIGVQGLTLLAMYAVGMVVAPLVALVLKRTRLKGPAVPFLLELPPYKVPSWRVVLFRVYDRCWAFVRRAGTIILATAIIIWALSYFPTQPDVTARFDTRRAAASAATSDAGEIERLDRAEAGERLRGSFLGRAGVAIEPLVRPLGWDWRIGMATLASFPAREVVIAALGTIFSLGDGQDENSGELRSAMRRATWPDGTPLFTPAVALSVMVFFALCSQCAATLATIRRETGSWAVPAFTFAYMTTLAYIVALAVYQVGSRVF